MSTACEFSARQDEQNVCTSFLSYATRCQILGKCMRVCVHVKHVFMEIHGNCYISHTYDSCGDRTYCFNGIRHCCVLAVLLHIEGSSKVVPQPATQSINTRLVVACAELSLQGLLWRVWCRQRRHSLLTLYFWASLVHVSGQM